MGATTATARLPIVGWPTRAGEGKAGEVIEVIVEVSFDGGATWSWEARMGMHGGDAFDPRGNLRVEHTMRVALPEAESTTRRMRARLELTEALETGLDVDVE